MKFIDLDTQREFLGDTINRRIETVINHGKFINGPEVSELEVSLSSYIGVRNAIGCSSGTDALLLALMAYGIGPGDAVFTTPFTFIATAEVIGLLGATPVFVDIDPRTFNIDPEKLDAAIQSVSSNDSPFDALANSAKTGPLVPRGIIGVDLFGLPADYDRVNTIAKKYCLFVIEDGAQSFGAESSGVKACALADIGCTSFFPAKPLGCYGDGGMCFTDNSVLAETMRSLRAHGSGNHKYDNVRLGINGRLDTLQAAILLGKFEIFPEEIEKRQICAKQYDEMIGADGGVTTPWIPGGKKSAWAQYSVLFQSEEMRKACQTRMKEANIPTAIYYPKPLHLQTAFAWLGYKDGAFPVSESISRRVMSLPMHPYLTMEDQEKIVRTMIWK